MNVKNVLFSIFLLIGFSVFAQPDNYKFGQINISNGLSNNQVLSIFKDSEGFIWFGTMSGLNRFDGYSFKIFKHSIRDSSSIRDNFIAGICEDHTGKLWITTRNEINIFDPLTESFRWDIETYLKEISVPFTTVHAIYKDRSGSFWFLNHERGLVQKNTDKGIDRNIYHNPKDSFSIYPSQLSAIAEDYAGYYWIMHRDGMLEKMDSKTGRVIYRDKSISKICGYELSDYTIFIDSDNDLWIVNLTTPQGVVYFNSTQKKFRNIQSNTPDSRLNTNIVRSVTQNNNGFIWVATDHGGINIIDKKTFSVSYVMNNPDDEKSISQNSITSLYKDDNGIIWLGTFKKGVNYFHENLIRFKLYKHHTRNPNSLSFDDVNCFVEDEKGNLWIGTNGGGLIYYDRTSDIFRQYLNNPKDPAGISANVIVSLCIDYKKQLWIGTYNGGLNRFDKGVFKHYKNNPLDSLSLSNNSIWKIYQDRQNRLWIGTLGSGLDLFNREKETFAHYNTKIPWTIYSNFITDILQDNEGDLWVGTAYGISVLKKEDTRNKQSFLHVTNNEQSLSNNNVNCLLEDLRGRIWIGTREGLCFYDKKTKKFRVFREEDGLCDNTVNSLLEDNLGNIWAGTPNGLSNVIITKKPGEEEITYLFKNYFESDGLQGKEFNYNAALVTKKGELVFGGPNGFNIFQPQGIKVNMNLPKVVLIDLQIFNKSIKVNEKINNRVLLQKAISETDAITLKYSENVFAIDFAALTYFQPEKNKYAYKLEGFSSDWIIIDSKVRKATYTNLDPGEYIFKVKASNNDGFWNEEPISLHITILPPFWRTKLAITLYVLVLLLILYFSRRIMLDRARMRFNLEHARHEAERRHELDMLKIKFFTNISHEFRTPLTLIITPLEKLIKNTIDQELNKQYLMISRNAKRLLNLVNQLLDFRRMEVQEFHLNPVKGDVIPFIRDIAYSFSDISEKKNIDLSVVTPLVSLTMFFDQDKLEKILFNLLSNAFKFTGEKGSVRVDVNIIEPSINQENSINYLEIKVNDTGIGIVKEKHEKIFERFFQNDLPGNMLNQGSGIGLALVKEFVKLHEGSVSIESESGKGSCFIVCIPIKTEIDIVENVYPVKERIETKDLHSEESETEPANRVRDNKMPLLLLVEDNEDFRFYLKDNLKQYYQIIEARNGSEGFGMAKNVIPDLIVSDVMMPVMDGIEFCKKVKSDARTSHIPVILLTAKASDDQILVGFDTGADDYITKPFNFEILLSRIRNLLLQRDTMRKSFMKHIDVNPSEITVTSLDEKLINKALAVVEKNLGNASFSVEDLSKELAMSRVHLYKKLLSITGKSPIEFIRTIRLKRAAQLLKKSQLTISEIAYQVGFNNPKYFTKYFKSEFKMLPSQFISNEKKEE